jgi:hypothetical protein
MAAFCGSAIGAAYNVCYPFRIFLGRIDTDESEGAFMGQNDRTTSTSELSWQTTGMKSCANASRIRAISAATM